MIPDPRFNPYRSRISGNYMRKRPRHPEVGVCTPRVAGPTTRWRHQRMRLSDSGRRTSGETRRCCAGRCFRTLFGRVRLNETSTLCSALASTWAPLRSRSASRYFRDLWGKANRSREGRCLWMKLPYWAIDYMCLDQRYEIIGQPGNSPLSTDPGNEAFCR